MTTTPRPLARLWQSASVRRWHANPVLAKTRQTNGDHQGRCVLLLLALHPNPCHALIRAVASHDVGEMGAGDLPGPFKRGYRDIADAHALAETAFRDALFGPDQYLTPDEQMWLQLVDGLDAHAWCLVEAPAEYDRLAAGWLDRQGDLFALARDLGCEARVSDMIRDLRSGTW